MRVYSSSLDLLLSSYGLKKDMRSGDVLNTAKSYSCFPACSLVLFIFYGTLTQLLISGTYESGKWWSLN